MSGFLRVERTGAVATIWIDRQAKMNTMTVAMRNEFPGIFAGLDADAAVRAVVVRGAGGKAFSAGGDVSEFLTLAPADLELWGDTLTSAERCRKPVIAAIDGHTMGAGLELAVACDFRIASPRPECSFPPVRVGMGPAGGGRGSRQGDGPGLTPSGGSWRIALPASARSRRARSAISPSRPSVPASSTPSG